MRSRVLSPWDLLALAGLAGLLAFHLAVEPGLPARVAIHFDAAGRPDGWAPKAQLPWILFGLPGFVWLLLLTVGAATAASVEDPERARLMAGAPLRGTLTFGACWAMAGVLAVPSRGTVALQAGLAGLVAAVVVGVLALLRQARRLPLSAEEGRHWRGGVFYHNPEDPRLWVPKRLGIGWTLNYARPSALWITLALLTVPLGAVVLALLRARS